MSDTDSFIDEVNDELRRDQMMGAVKRYAWIVVLVVLVIVGGATFREYRKSQTEARAQAFGDSINAALQTQDAQARATALAALDAADPTGQAMLDLLTASEQIAAEDRAAAVETLNAVALNAQAPQIYRQIAQFKALTLLTDTLSADERRQGFEALMAGGGTMRLLAQEQLALIALEENDTGSAIAQYQTLLTDAEVTPDLQQRALQVIVALGGEPDFGGTPDLSGAASPASENN